MNAFSFAVGLYRAPTSQPICQKEEEQNGIIKNYIRRQQPLANACIVFFLFRKNTTTCYVFLLVSL